MVSGHTETYIIPLRAIPDYDKEDIEMFLDGIISAEYNNCYFIHEYNKEQYCADVGIESEEIGDIAGVGHYYDGLASIVADQLVRTGALDVILDKIRIATITDIKVLSEYDVMIKLEY